MRMKDWINQLLDLTIVFSFDHSGFKRHCPDQLQNGKFWFDRKQAKTTILNLNRSSEEEDELLWKYCESILASIKGLSR